MHAFTLTPTHVALIVLATIVAILVGEDALSMLWFGGFCYNSCSNGNCFGGGGCGACNCGYSQGGYNYSQGGYYSQGSYGGGYSQGGYNNYSQGGYSSTPFIYIQKQDGSFSLENDVMFGKPSSYFKEINYGIAAYRSGGVAGDLYKVKTNLINKNGTVTFEIREIEPEVSALFGVGLYRMSKLKDSLHLSRSDFKGVVTIALNQPAVNVERFEASTTKLKDAAKGLFKEVGYIKSSTHEDALTLESEEYVEFTIRKPETHHNEEVYLLLESWYRDWTLGNVYTQSGLFDEPTPSYMQALFSRKNIAVGTLALFAGLFGVQHYTDNQKVLGESFGLVPKVYADVPYTQSSYYSQGSYRSLEVSYKTSEGYTLVDVVEPRYARPDTVAVALPAHIFSQGTATIKIKATKRHKLVSLSVAAGVYTDRADIPSLHVTEVLHERTGVDHTADFKNADNMNPVITYPSDKVRIQFAVPESNNDKEDYEYFFASAGVYAPASAEDQATVPNWVNKLDKEAKQFLKTTYRDAIKKA